MRERQKPKAKTKVIAETETSSGWQWLTRYRVWDADRKVFVYPENWIEPKERMAPALRASLLGIAAIICPDCEGKSKKEKGRSRRVKAGAHATDRRKVGSPRSEAEGTGTDSSKRVTLKGVRLIFLATKLKGALVAAQLLARELGQDLYRIDLSEVVSKYIGETEKNLDFVFRAPGSREAILFFDEADALFGKRTQVHDAHERYADLEVDYLLHRVEHHAGVSILRFASREHMSRPSLARFHFTVAIKK